MPFIRLAWNLKCVIVQWVGIWNKQTYFITCEFRKYSKLAVPGHTLLWLGLIKWKRKKRESTRFEYV